MADKRATDGGSEYSAHVAVLLANRGEILMLVNGRGSSCLGSSSGGHARLIGPSIKVIASGVLMVSVSPAAASGLNPAKRKIGEAELFEVGILPVSLSMRGDGRG